MELLLRLLVFVVHSMVIHFGSVFRQLIVFIFIPDFNMAV
jgi:hypothetical protein